MIKVVHVTLDNDALINVATRVGLQVMHEVLHCYSPIDRFHIIEIINNHIIQESQSYVSQDLHREFIKEMLNYFKLEEFDC